MIRWHSSLFPRSGHEQLCVFSSGILSHLTHDQNCCFCCLHLFLFIYLWSALPGFYIFFLKSSSGGPLFLVRLMKRFSEIIGSIFISHRYLMNIKSGRWKSHRGLLLVVSVGHVFTSGLDHSIWILGFSFNPASPDSKADTPRVCAVL